MYINFKETFSKSKPEISKGTIKRLNELSNEDKESLIIENKNLARNINNKNANISKFEIQIESNEITKKVNMLKIYDEKDNIIIFSSVKESPIQISYILNEAIEKIKFNINLEIELCKTINECIECLNIYKSFLDGKLKILGEFINSNKQEQEIEVINSMIDFYNKIEELSKTLNIEFKPKKNLSQGEIKEIESLYDLLINKQVLREEIKEDIKVVNNNKIDISKIIKNGMIELISVRNTKWNILNKQVELPGIIGLFDFHICDMKENHVEGRFEYIFSIKNSNAYKSYKIFKNMNELIKYKEDDDIVKKLKES